jgi:hypothetical protein
MVSVVVVVVVVLRKKIFMNDVKITITYHDGLMTWQKKEKRSK